MSPAPPSASPRRTAHAAGVARAARIARSARACACIAALGTTARAGGPLDEPHASGYYWARGGAVAGAAALTIATMAVLEPARPEPGPSEWLDWDNSVRGQLSRSASAASDVTLLAAVAMPFGFGSAYGFDRPSLNASLVYGEVLWTNLLFNTVVKYTAPRLRPYNYRVPPAVDYVDAQGVDAYLSFYSGHASTAFAAAVGGSYLFSAAHPDSNANPWLWGIESAMASATAIWRVRAGKHFYSDVAVGIVAGSAIGVGIPLLEGVRRAPSATEMGFAAGGVLAGSAIALVAPFDQDGALAVDAMRLHVRVLPAWSAQTTGVVALGAF